MAFCAAMTGAIFCAIFSMYSALLEKILSTSASGMGCVSATFSLPRSSTAEPGDHQQTTIVAVDAHLLEERDLVGEDVSLVAVIVVEVTQVVVEEDRRAGRRDNPGSVDLGDVVAAAVHAALTLLLAEVALGALRDVVDHRVPDRARVLQQMDVDLPEASVSGSRSTGLASFMLKQVVSPPSETTRPESPIGPSAGARRAMIMMSRSPLGPLTVCLTESSVSKNLWKPSFSSSRLRSGTG